MRAWIGVGVILLGVACGVPGGALPSDGGAGPACETSRDCEDGARCTSDTCTGGRCVRTLEDSLCDDNPGGMCIPDDPGANMEGCIYRACDPEVCEPNETNAMTCEIGVCDTELDVCVATSTCEEGESCCGDGTCRNCDDGNPCTADTCVDGACDNRALVDQPCNDGDPCTVSDTCDASGACNGSTCETISSMLVCEPGIGCVGCTDDIHCPNETPDFGPCQYGPLGTLDACIGVRQRELRIGTCVDRMCEFVMVPESDPCTRMSNNVRCGGDIVGGFSACDYDPPTPPETLSCDNSAMRSRSRTIFRCEADTTNCEARMQMNASDTETCSRNQNGMTCRDDDNGPWGPCVQNSATTCNGTETRNVTQYACAAGSCGSSGTTDTRGCVIADGTTTCGSPSMVVCGATPCTRTGNNCTGTCRDEIMTPTCTAGGCTMVSTMSAPHACDMPVGLGCGPGREAPGACMQTAMTCMGTQQVLLFVDQCDGSGNCVENSAGMRTDTCNMPGGTSCDDGNDTTCNDMCGNLDGMCNGSACPDAGFDGGMPDAGPPDVGPPDTGGSEDAG